MMTRLLFAIVIVLAFVLGSPASSFADKRTLYRVSVLAHGALRSSSDQSVLHVRVHTTEGLHLLKLRPVDSPAVRGLGRDVVRLYRGILRNPTSLSTSLGVAGDLIGDTLTLHFHGRKGRRSYSVGLIVPSPSSSSYLAKAHQYRMSRAFPCRETRKFQSYESFLPKAPFPYSRAEGLMELDVAVSGDAEWVRRNRGLQKAQAEIVAALNAVSAIYLEQLGITLKLADLKLFKEKSSQPFTKKGAAPLLTQFQQYQIENAPLLPNDLELLFSGKNFRGSTIGRAYQGVTCRSPFFRFGIVQRVAPALQTVLIAHEIGHTLDASHDNRGKRNIMSASLRARAAKRKKSARSFSNRSIAEVQEHVEEHGMCLIEENLPYSSRPTVEQVSLSVNSEFSARIRDFGDTSCSLQLLFLEKVSNLLSLPTVFPVNASDVGAGVIEFNAPNVDANGDRLSNLTLIVRKSCAGFSDTVSKPSEGRFVVESEGTLSTAIGVANAVLNNLSKLDSAS